MNSSSPTNIDPNRFDTTKPAPQPSAPLYEHSTASTNKNSFSYSSVSSDQDSYNLDAPPAYEEGDIGAWWDSLTYAQRTEIQGAYYRLSTEDKNKIEQSKTVHSNNVLYNPAARPQAIYVYNYTYLNSPSPKYHIYYDYFTMCQMARVAGELASLNFSLNMLILESAIRVGSKIGHAAISAAPKIIDAGLYVGHASVHAVSSIGTSVISASSSAMKSGANSLGNAANSLSGRKKEGGSGDFGPLAVLGVILAVIIVAAAAIGTAVTFAGYALKKAYESTRDLLKFRRPVESALTIGAVGSGALLGTLKGALVGAIIGSAIPVIGTAIGAVLGAVIGACVTAGLFAIAAKAITRVVAEIKIKAGWYSRSKDINDPSKNVIISHMHPDEYIISKKDEKNIVAKTKCEFAPYSHSIINQRLMAIHQQRKDVSFMKVLPWTDAAQEYDDLKKLRIEGIKGGKALKNDTFSVGKRTFIWNKSTNHYDSKFSDHDENRNHRSYNF